MKVVHVSRADDGGGAARATYRLHRALRAHAVDSLLCVDVKKSGDWTVTGPSGRVREGIALARPTVGQVFRKLHRTENRNLHSVAILPSRHVRRINESDRDLVNLHWVCGEMISIEQLGRIRKPVVWTLHDMWPFSGAEHHGTFVPGSRWQVGYTRSSRPVTEGGVDLNRWVYRRKVHSWKRPMSLVAPSRWLADCVRRSSLMGSWPVAVIPNVLDTSVFRPHPKELARSILGWDAEERVILFGAISEDHLKGYDLLLGAFEHLRHCKLEKMRGVILGKSEPRVPAPTWLPLKYLGTLSDDITLSLVYSAADVVVVPSRQENLPQMGTEAQACGVPVVGFDVAGLPDVVENGRTGYLAKAYSCEDLAAGIAWVLCDNGRARGLRAAARDRATRLWSPERVVPQYIDLYARVIGRQ